MKRALAERAKQSGHPNGLAPPVVHSSSSPDHPPHKIPKVEKSERLPKKEIKQEAKVTQQQPTSSHQPTQQQRTGPSPIRIPPKTQQNESSTSRLSPKPSTQSSSSSSLSRSPKPSTNPVPVGSSGTSSGNNTPRSRSSGGLKRQRPGSTSSSNIAGAGGSADADNDEEMQQNAFYLKHQNSALASELQALQHKVRHLEKERDVRRQQCAAASQALRQLEGTWTQIEVALQLGNLSASKIDKATLTNQTVSSSVVKEDTPMSTGSGDSVELVDALLDALAALAKENNNIIENDFNDKSIAVDATKAKIKEDTLNDETNDKPLAKAAITVSRRATVLQQWIWTLLQNIHKKSLASNDEQQQEDNNESSSPPSILDIASLKGKISTLENQCRECETRIAELAKARDEASESDRRVRRGLYRIKAGRMKVDEVLNDLEDDGNKEAAALAMSNIDAAVVTDDMGVVKSNDIKSKGDAMEDGDDEKEAEKQVDSAQLAALKKQIQDLEEISKSREKQIDDYVKERESHLKRINSLIFAAKEDDSKALSDEDIKRSTLYVDANTKLMSAERQLKELQDRMKDIKKQWATSKGDAELATKSLDELTSKHKKRWTELTMSPSENDRGADADETTSDDGETNTKEDKGDISTESAVGSLGQAKQIIELEHKLNQALENVRQADTVRISLGEAMKMNESLQIKLEEMKTKNAMLVAGKTASRASLDGGVDGATGNATSSSQTSSSSSKERQSSSGSSSSVSADKFRKMRKELAAAVASKEGAKAKQDRAEKERDALVKTNTRLLRQSAEKDDTNAKSLSTILHLKHQTELLAQEKELLEQKAKSSGQLALAARLATNAKERVAEEAIKEKKALEEKLFEIQEKCESLLRAKEAADGQLANVETETESLKNDALKSRQRCEELAEEATKLEEEKRRMSEALAVAQREASESAKKYANIISRDRGKGIHSEFTTEELTTQVSVLKGRLACPVCNHRDKKCILLRCRHMFCKQCVEENVRNRSRKCPACGQRFDNKDVADVWL